MDTMDIVYTVTLALLIVVAYLGIKSAIAWLKQSQTALEETRFGWLVEKLVEAAEEQIKGTGLGPERFDWVLTQLDERVPGFDEDLARTIISAAVLRMNRQQSKPQPSSPPALEAQG